MYRLSTYEFLLCYDGIFHFNYLCLTLECAIYVDHHGEISRSKVINWNGKPHATQVIGGKYVIAFDTSFIEIWRCDERFEEGGMRVVQIIPGRDVRMIGNEQQVPADGIVYVAMGHPETLDRDIVVELALRNEDRDAMDYGR